MKKQFLRILASFLAFVMLLSQLMPATASAFSTQQSNESAVISSNTGSTNLDLVMNEIHRYEKSQLAQKYTVAINLYHGIISDLEKNKTNEALLLDYYTSLKKAIDDAENQFNGKTYTVSTQLSHGTDILSAKQAEIEFKNIYGSTFIAKAGESIQLYAGTYTYTASIPSFGKKATGSFEVVVPVTDGAESGTEPVQSISVSFPGDDYWISSAYFHSGEEQANIEFAPVAGLKFDVPVIDNSTDTSLFTGVTLSDEALKFGTAYRDVTIKYTDNRSEVQNKTISSNTALPDFIPQDGKGRQEKYLVTLTDVDKSIVYTQEYVLKLERSPRTLKDLKVGNKDGYVPLSPSFRSDVTNYTVAVLETDTAIKIYPSAFSSYKNGYQVSINGTLAQEDGYVTVPLKAQGESQEQIRIEVKHNDDSKASTYVITPVLLKTVQYGFSIPKGAEISVSNSVGTKIPILKSNLGQKETDYYSFTLAEGQPYSYKVTKNTYYQTVGDLTGVNGEKTVTVDTQDYIDSFRMGEKDAKTPYIDYKIGDKLPNKMSVTIPDYVTQVRMNVALKEGATKYNVSANYQSQTKSLRTNGITKSVQLNHQTDTMLTDFLRNSGASQKCDLIVSREDGDCTRQQVYTVQLKRELSLSSDTAPIFVNSTTGELQTVYYSPSWDREKNSGYVLSVPEDAQNLLVTLRQNGAVLCDEFKDPAYKITVNGVETEPTGAWEEGYPLRQAAISLNGTKKEETIQIKLSHESGAKAIYEFKVKKVKSVKMIFNIDPHDARFTLTDKEGSRIWPDKTGKYNVVEGAEYKYVLSKADYVTVSDSFIANEDVSTMSLSIKPAEKNEKIDPTIDVEWNKFRGEDNNGVTKRATPASAEEAQLRWAYKSSGMSHVGQPIVLDNYVAILNGKKLQYLDPISGKLVAEGKLESSCGVVPVFSNGMIFVPESSALQAFNASPRPQTEADTGYTDKDVMVLDSLWIYKDPIGGAGTTPFYIKDGYIYGGWQQVRRNGAFVCLSITDEDPKQTNEAKEATWRWVRKKGGFYWAGAHVNERFVVVGGEESGEDDLVCLDTVTGKVLDRLSNIFTDANRGCVSYDKGTDRYCLVTKEEFFSVKVDDNGKFYSVKKASLGGMSTSTPAIYNGRAYIGCSGNGQFQAFTGSGIMVFDVESAQPVYAMKTRGYPQSSGLISTAYMDVPHYNPQTKQMEKGFVYVYFDENINPGNVSYIIDKPGITEPVKSENIEGIETAPLLFAPKGAHAQYCLSSLQVDKYGTLYMKTDAGYILAIGSKIESLEVRQNPDKTVYFPGDSFDPTGMKVYAKYLNGTELDVTKYVTPVYEENSGGVLNVKQSSITMKFNYALYNNFTPNDYIDSERNSTFDKLPRPEVAVPIVVLADEQVRQVDEVIQIINDIGKVEFTVASKNKIDFARKACAALDPNLRAAITNFKILQDAKERYDQLTVASQNKLPISNVIDPQLDKLTVSIPKTVKLDTPTADLAQMFTLNLEELLAVESGAQIQIGVNNKPLNYVPDTEQFILKSVLQDRRLVEAGNVFDLSMYKKIGDLEQEQVSELHDNQKVRIEIPIPVNCRSKNRLFYLVNIHGAEANILRDLAPEDDTKVVVETGKFSTYVLTYAWLGTSSDKPLPTPTLEPLPVNRIDSKAGEFVANRSDVQKISDQSGFRIKEEAVKETEKETAKETADIDKKEAKVQEDDKDALTKKPSSFIAEEKLKPTGERLTLIIWISCLLAVVAGGVIGFRFVRKKKATKK